jgi:hypothetical protein
MRYVEGFEFGHLDLHAHGARLKIKTNANDSPVTAQ